MVVVLLTPQPLVNRQSGGKDKRAQERAGVNMRHVHTRLSVVTGQLYYVYTFPRDRDSLQSPSRVSKAGKDSRCFKSLPLQALVKSEQEQTERAFSVVTLLH